MITSLAQKRGLEHRIHTLLEDRVIVETKTALKHTRYEIPLDNLRFDLRYQSDNPRSNQIATLVIVTLPVLITVAAFLHNSPTLSLPFVLFIWVMFGAMCWLCSFKKPQDDLFLTGGKNHLALFRTAPNEVLVMTFVTQVHEAIRAYLKDKHLSAVQGSDGDYQKMVQWLLSEKVISPVEADRYRERFHLQNMDMLYRHSLN